MLKIIKRDIGNISDVEMSLNRTNKLSLDDGNHYMEEELAPETWDWIACLQFC